MRDERHPALFAEVDEPTPHCGVVEDAQPDLDGGNPGNVERLRQLAPVRVRNADVADQPVARQRRECSNRSVPRRSRVRGVEEIQVDGQPIECREARLAIGANRPGATIWNPLIARAHHPSLCDDACAPGGAARSQRLRDTALVPSGSRRIGTVRVRGVEDHDPGRNRGCDRCCGDLLIAVTTGRETHAAEADAEVGSAEPCGGVQVPERTAPSLAIRPWLFTGCAPRGVV